MALRDRGQYVYGDSADDIREVLAHPYHEALPCTEFVDVVCECGNRVFDLQIDDTYQQAEFICRACKQLYLFHTADTDAPYAGNPKADTTFRACPCNPHDPRCYLEIVIGAALVSDSEIPCQVSIGCRCVKCGLVGPYADWRDIQIPFRRVFAHVRNVPVYDDE